ncbi:glycosyltransferase [Sphingobium lactosutens]|nr:glycosyltransferase [Sphingobium lactosutens]
MVSFLDIDFCDLSLEDALAAILKRPAGAPFAYVVTPNVDHVVRIQRRRSDLWPAYRSAWLCLCDSRILSRLAARAGVNLPATPGSDLTAALLRAGHEPGDRIAIVGGSETLVDCLQSMLPMVDFVRFNPPMGFVANPHAFAAARDFLIDAQARFAILAVGSPQQELLAWHVARSGRATGTALCVGASLDFLTGEQRRAPEWMQMLSMEWLFRLLTNPRRLWRRYMIEGPVILPIYRNWLARRRRSRVRIPPGAGLGQHH